MPQETDSKTEKRVIPCRKCGRILPAGTAVCPYCMEPQIVPRNAVMPKSSKLIWIRTLLVLAAILAIYFLIIRLQENRIFENGTEKVPYGNYTVILLTSESYADPKGFVQCSEVRGRESTIPIQIHVLDRNGESASERFSSRVQDIEAAVVRTDGPGRAYLTDLREDNRLYYPESLRVFSLAYSSSIERAELAVTLKMKNGDEIILHGGIEVTETPLISFIPSEGQENGTPAGEKDTFFWKLDSAEEVQDLIDRIDGGQIEETSLAGCSVSITLRPLVYQGDLQCRNSRISLYGTGEEPDRTTLIGSLIMNIPKHSTSQLYNMILQSPADGTGTGLTAYGLVSLRDCVIRNYEIGILCRSYGWVDLKDTLFESNGTGLFLDALQGPGTETAAVRNTFRGNRTAVVVEQSKVNVFTFDDCIFEDNGTDLVNHTQASYLIRP